MNKSVAYAVETNGGAELDSEVTAHEVAHTATEILKEFVANSVD